MTTETRQAIRHAYKNWQPRSDPYSYFDWANLFTPIEDNVWSEIRFLGLPFYPQYPVGRYFVDFADPVKKIAIEVDGRVWHMDKEKDNRRENEIANMGWTIVRFKGRETFHCGECEDSGFIEILDESGDYSKIINCSCIASKLRDLRSEYY